MLFANGAELLGVSTMGIPHYIAPTMIFLIAVFAFDEGIDRARVVALPLIWVALIVYSISMLRKIGARLR